MKHIFLDASGTLFYEKNHHADYLPLYSYMMVLKLSEFTVIDCLHDGIGGYDI